VSILQPIFALHIPNPTKFVCASTSGPNSHDQYALLADSPQSASFLQNAGFDTAHLRHLPSPQYSLSAQSPAFTHCSGTVANVESFVCSSGIIVVGVSSGFDSSFGLFIGIFGIIDAGIFSLGIVSPNTGFFGTDDVITGLGAET